MGHRGIFASVLIALTALALTGCDGGAGSDTASWVEIGDDGTGELTGYIAALDYAPTEAGVWEGYIEMVREVESTDSQRLDIAPTSEIVSAADPEDRDSLQVAFEYLFRKLEAADEFVVRFHQEGESLVIDELVPQAPWGEAFFLADPIPDAPLADPAAPVLDEEGRSPIDAVQTYFDARIAGEPEAIYAAYAPGAPPDYEVWLAEWEEYPWALDATDVLEQRVIGDRAALVRVTYRETSSTSTVEVEWPGEWWRVEKVDGRWYVGWMPRQ